VTAHPTTPIFDRHFDPRHGEAVQVAPGIRRVVAANASAFTFHGTGTYIVGEGEVAVIDPGPLRRDHFEALTKALAGETVAAILITHTHLDHSPLAASLKASTGAPTHGFGPHGGAADGDAVEEGADRDFVPDIALTDGDLVEGPGWTFEAVHTPGHTSNHLCFAYREGNALFSGDHVMGWSTSVISPPDGDMAAYMASLEKLLRREEAVYYPTHGNPIRDPKAHVESFIAHRLDREAQILACLERGLDTVVEMVPAMYREVPQHLHPAAARSVLAHLIRMVDDGRVRCPDAMPGPRSRYSPG
jgi:glyoxylase-like metal-dependent hydrolase (beta-lactamase superfamily II)